MREDGRYAYQTKRGVTLVMTEEQLVRRLLSLIPPKGLHLTNFHGVFASHSRMREKLVPQRTVREENTRSAGAGRSAPQSAGDLPRMSQKKRPRLDWAALHARTWQVDVWRCPCGGRRKVTAVVTSGRTAERVLENMGLLGPRPPLPAAQSPPQLTLAV